MHQHRKMHLHPAPHHIQRRQFGDAWGQFTSAVAGVFAPPAPTNTPPNARQDGGNSNGPPGGSGGNSGGSGGNRPPQQPQQQQDQDQTIFSTIFLTMTPEDFGGGPLTTLTGGQGLGGAGATPTQDDSLAEATGFPQTEAQTQPGAAPTQLTVATGAPTANQVPAATTSTAPQKSSNDGASDTAAKAGIVIGVLAGVGVLLLVAMILMKKRKKQKKNQRLDDDEKLNGPFGSATLGDTFHGANSTPSTTKAPRLSLRPVTQFLPNLGGHGGQSQPERRASRGANIAMVTSPQSRSPGQSAWERPMTSNSSHHANPFGDNAERLHSPIPEERPLPVSPISEDGEMGHTMSSNSPPGMGPMGAVAGGAAAGMGVAAAGVGLSRKASIRKDVPKPLDLTLPPSLGAVPPSPAGTEFSINTMGPGDAPAPSSGAAAIAAAGGPPSSTVHRIQLDFKPTLEDEMELRAGQLVRLLHEYDDGWVSFRSCCFSIIFC
jgi:hypothetical protein